jgi:hypothetical protein
MRLAFPDQEVRENGEGLSVLSLTGIQGLWVTMSARPNVEGQGGSITAIVEHRDDDDTWVEACSMTFPDERGAYNGVAAIAEADIKDQLRGRWTIAAGVWYLEIAISPMAVDKGAVLETAGILQAYGVLPRRSLIL